MTSTHILCVPRQQTNIHTDTSPLWSAMRVHTMYPAPPPPPTTPLTFSLLQNFNHRHALPSLLLLLLLFVLPAATTQLQNPPPWADPLARLRYDKTMTTVLVVLVVAFFILGLFSIYTRQSTERRLRGRFDLAIPITGGGSILRPPRGLDLSIIDTFPIFLYSEVKGLKIGRATTLECAVCLSEFGDNETLRLIPKCSHVFHRDCIDVWLVSHSTCPVLLRQPRTQTRWWRVILFFCHDPNPWPETRIAWTGNQPWPELHYPGRWC